MEGEKKEMLYEEKERHAASGWGMLLLNILMYLASVAGMVFGIMRLSEEDFVLGGVLLGVSVVLLLAAILVSCGFRVLNPKEGLVLVLFGKYWGTIKKEGFYWVNPFCIGVNPTVSSATSWLLPRRVFSSLPSETSYGYRRETFLTTESH